MNNRRMFRLMVFCFFVLILGAGACNSARKASGDSPELVNGVLVDQTGLGTCSWLIELSDGSRVEPVNLADFSVEMVVGKKVRLAYEELPEAMSGCMAGPIVKLLRLSEE